MKTILYFFILTLLVMPCDGQITLDTELRGEFVNFHEWGTKYVVKDYENLQVVLYNPDNYSVFHSFQVPDYNAINNLSFLSNGLFDNDNSTIEYLVSGGNVSMRILREDGAVLFEGPYSTMTYMPNMQTQSEWTGPIVNTSHGTKMTVYPIGSFNSDRLVYSLPGTYLGQCCCCTEGHDLHTPAPLTNQKPGLYPNPAREMVKIEYTLPAGTGTAPLVVYDIKGREVAKHTVGSAFTFMLLDTSTLMPGNYLVRIGDQPAMPFIKL